MNIKKNNLLLLLCLLHAFALAGQTDRNVIKTPGFPHYATAPNRAPSVAGGEIAIDTFNRLWMWNRPTKSWMQAGYLIQVISGCAPPAYTPGRALSPLVINNCGEIYQYRNNAWFLASDTLSAQTLTWNGGTGVLSISGNGNSVSLDGRYLTSANYQNLSINGQLLSISNGNTITIPSGPSYTPGSGINISGNVISNTGDLASNNEGSLNVQPGTNSTSVIRSNTAGSQDVTLQVSGNATIAESGNTITIGFLPYNAGPGITLSNNTITATDTSSTNEIQNLSISGQVLSISGGNSVTLPAGTTYTAGNGINISGNNISNTGDLLSTNEGSLTVQSGTSTTSVLQSNTSGSTDVTLSAGSGISLSESGNTITITNSNPNQTQVLSISGSNVSLSGGGGTITLPAGTVYTAGAGITISGSSIAAKDSIANGTRGDIVVTNTGSTLTVGNGVITNAKIASNAIDSSKIAAGAVQASDIGAGQITSPKLNQMGATTGQVLKWNGSAWAPLTDQTGGGSYVAGTGIAIAIDTIRASNIPFSALSSSVQDSIRNEVIIVRDSASFAANTKRGDVVIMRDTLRGGVFMQYFGPETADNYMIFQDAAGQKWKRNWDNVNLYPEWFGANAKDANSDNVQIQACVNYAIQKNLALVCFQAGTYTLARPIVLVRPSTGGNYSFLDLDLKGAGAGNAYNTTSPIRQTYFFMNGAAAAVLVQNARSVKITDIAFRGVLPSFNIPQSIVRTDADWASVGRANSRSPEAAIVVDPFHSSVTGSNQYPNTSSYYTNSSSAGSSFVQIEGCSFQTLMVAIMISPNGTTQNCDNVTAWHCTFQQCRTVWATGQTQSRGNSIKDCYITGCAELLNTSSYGAGSGTPPTLQDLNIAGGMKWLFGNAGGFDVIKMSNVYCELLYSIGRATTGITATGCTFAFITQADLALYGIAFMPSFHVSAPTSIWTGCVFKYFVNCTEYNSIFFVGSLVNAPPTFDGCTFEACLPVSQFVNSPGQATDHFQFNNCRLICNTPGQIGGNQWSRSPITSLEAKPVVGGTRIFSRMGFTIAGFYEERIIQGSNYHVLPQATVTITVDSSLRRAKFYNTTLSKSLKVGDQLVSESNSFSGGNPFGFTGSRPYLGAVGAISNDTIYILNWPYGLPNNASWFVYSMSMPILFSARYGNFTSGSNVATSVSSTSEITAGTRLFSSALPANGAIVTSVTSNTITFNQNATSTASDVYIYNARRELKMRGRLGDFQTGNLSYVAGDRIDNLELGFASANDSIDHWICIRGGITNAGGSREPLWDAVRRDYNYTSTTPNALSITNSTRSIGLSTTNVNAGDAPMYRGGAWGLFKPVPIYANGSTLLNMGQDSILRSQTLFFDGADGNISYTNSTGIYALSAGTYELSAVLSGSSFSNTSAGVLQVGWYDNSLVATITSGLQAILVPTSNTSASSGSSISTAYVTVSSTKNVSLRVVSATGTADVSASVSIRRID